MLPFHSSLQKLYDSTPWTVNDCESYEMDQLLFALQTPAHQSLFVLQHAFRVSGGNTIDTVLAHCHHLWKPKSEFDGPRLEACLKEQQQQQQQQQRDSQKEVVAAPQEPHSTATTISMANFYSINKPQSSKQIVDQIIRASYSNNGEPQILLPLLQRLYRHLYLTLGTDLRNGAAADIAFSLSLTGIGGGGGGGNQDTDNPTNGILQIIHAILDCACHIAAMEIHRKKTKGSRRATDILMVVEKLAAAGCRGIYYEAVIAAAASSLEGSKGFQYLPKGVVDASNNRLWSPRPLLWLWRRGHLLHKVSPQDMASAQTMQTLSPPSFEDSSLPLVVDVGCGLGVSLIGLLVSAQMRTANDDMSSSTPPALQPLPTTTTTTSPQQQQPLNFLQWDRCNYLGGDLSPAAIRWARGLTARWELKGQCEFYHASTETLLNYLLQAKIPVSLLLLLFPTPYRLQHENDEDDEISSSSSAGCNLKLPFGPTDDSFMANPRILTLVAQILQQSRQATNRPTHVLVQSNCEDVALHIYDTLTDLGMEALPSAVPRNLESLLSATPSKRTTAWLQEQERRTTTNVRGVRQQRRAAGKSWSAEPYLPVFTETEVSCMHKTSTPVHRCLFQANRS